jgi:teichuronic acid biosynthesis glycosyltransferase TuaG
MKTKLVSVILTTYNRVDLISLTIDSILSQTYKNIELIIIDDGSSDGTFEKINRYNDKRVSCFLIKNSGGPAVPRNIGIKHSNGEYIAFCDDDDIWMSNKIDVQMNYIIKNNIDFVSSNMIVFNNNIDNILYISKNKKIKSLFSFLNKNEINTSTVLLKKTSIVSFNEGEEFLNCGEDYSLWLKLYMNNYSFGFINDPLVYYRSSHGNISNKAWYNSHIIKIIIYLKILLDHRYNFKLFIVVFYLTQKNLLYYIVKQLKKTVIKN